MAGRSFLMTSPHEGNRKLLQRALKLPQVSDGMIQGKSVRLILKKRPHQTIFAMPTGCRKSTSTKLRRVLKMRLLICWRCRNLGIAAGRKLHTVEGTPGETVIEAKELTKKFGDFAATDHVNFAVKRGEILVCWGQTARVNRPPLR
ncbi:Putative ATP-binding component of a transport system [Escherichia coli]|nr:Putative ATP-binding component of a transport system [Escherichia coli]